jgi:hypothetical protein
VVVSLPCKERARPGAGPGSAEFRTLVNEAARSDVGPLSEFELQCSLADTSFERAQRRRDMV